MSEVEELLQKDPKTIMRSIIQRIATGPDMSKDISQAEFGRLFASLRNTDASARFGEPELLMTEPEWQSVQGRLKTAGKLERRAS